MLKKNRKNVKLFSKNAVQKTRIDWNIRPFFATKHKKPFLLGISPTAPSSQAPNVGRSMSTRAWSCEIKIKFGWDSTRMQALLQNPEKVAQFKKTAEEDFISSKRRPQWSLQIVSAKQRVSKLLKSLTASYQVTECNRPSLAKFHETALATRTLEIQGML